MRLVEDAVMFPIAIYKHNLEAISMKYIYFSLLCHMFLVLYDVVNLA